MILNVALTTVYCLDQTATRDFYVERLGFEPRIDATMGDFRWVTISHPNQPELEVTLMTPGPPLSPEAAAFVRGQPGVRRRVAVTSPARRGGAAAARPRR
jgi:catechol 2,3-dioxygenase-like lactoylglutathione lyase family enzyme